ncbi:hypothetical protein ACTNCI_06195 [Mitsuokella jalaludinii]|uniref:hypothetical protein n=1 Tax=Mitsuokella jalaludinii TaxID=187979 RepID=UPI003F8B19E3
MINTTAFHQSSHQSSHNDEYLTPPEAVRIVLPYVQGKRIWCPFDDADSAFVQVFEKTGLNVQHSTLSDGQDFFSYVPDCRTPGLQRPDCLHSEKRRQSSVTHVPEPLPLP